MKLKDWIAALEVRIEALEQQNTTDISQCTINNIEKRLAELEEAFDLFLDYLKKVKKKEEKNEGK